MGVWKPSGPDTPRPPIDIINDPSYWATESYVADPKARFEELSVDVELAPGLTGNELSRNAYIVCDKPGAPTILTDSPIPMRIGELRGRGAQLVAERIGALHTGLVASLVFPQDGSSTWTIQVNVPRPES